MSVSYLKILVLLLLVTFIISHKFAKIETGK